MASSTITAAMTQLIHQRERNRIANREFGAIWNFTNQPFLSWQGGVPIVRACELSSMRNEVQSLDRLDRHGQPQALFYFDQF